MEYLKQNDSGMYTIIQKIGCFFRAACHMAEIHESKALTVEQINNLWDKAVTFDYIGTRDGVQNCVKTSAKIATLALRELGNGTGYFSEVGLFKDGRSVYYPSVLGERRRTDYLIQKIKQSGPSITHFRNVNKDGSLLWEPHEPPLKVLDIYYSILYIYEEKNGK